MIGDDVVKKIRNLQAEKIKEDTRDASFSTEINEISKECNKSK